MILAIDSGTIVFAVFITAFVCSIVWPYYKQWRTKNWPSTSGTIAGAVSEPYRGGRSGNVAKVVIRYEFTVNGEAYGGEYFRLFKDEDEATRFAYGLKDQPIEVHYREEKPEDSGLVDGDVDRAQSMKPPPPDDLHLPVTPMSPVLQVAAIPLMVLAALGFGLALAVNIEGWMGQVILPGGFFFGLHIGIFVVFFPAVLASRTAGKNFSFTKPNKNVPRWMSGFAVVLFAYTFINFFYGFVSHSMEKHTGLRAEDWRTFSGHWMLFYYVAFMMLYSAYGSGAKLCCVNGHMMTSRETVCPQCGAARMA